MDFPERDWKHLRAVHSVALARYCERVLTEVSILAGDDGRSAHERYRHLVSVIGDRNGQMASAFDDMRRSVAIQRLAWLLTLNLLTESEFEQFSAETQAAAAALSDILRRPRLESSE